MTDVSGRYRWGATRQEVRPWMSNYLVGPSGPAKMAAALSWRTKNPSSAPCRKACLGLQRETPAFSHPFGICLLERRLNNPTGPLVSFRSKWPVFGAAPRPRLLFLNRRGGGACAGPVRSGEARLPGGKGGVVNLFLCFIIVIISIIISILIISILIISIIFEYYRFFLICFFRRNTHGTLKNGPLCIGGIH